MGIELIIKNQEVTFQLKVKKGTNTLACEDFSKQIANRELKIIISRWWRTFAFPKYFLSTVSLFSTTINFLELFPPMNPGKIKTWLKINIDQTLNWDFFKTPQNTLVWGTFFHDFKKNFYYFKDCGLLIDRIITPIDLWLKERLNSVVNLAIFMKYACVIFQPEGGELVIRVWHKDELSSKLWEFLLEVDCLSVSAFNIGTYDYSWLEQQGIHFSLSAIEL